MRIAFAAVILGLMSSAASAQRAQNWSFEDGTLQGWTAIGEAFANQPTYGNNIEARRPGERPGSAGDWWIGSYENRPSPSVPAGTVQGDGPTGYLVSPPFQIQSGTISFLIGGGNRANVVAALMFRQPDTKPAPGLIGLGDGYYLPAMFAEGTDTEFMSPVGWDVRGYRGIFARILIVDDGSGPWEHINVDDFRFSWINDALTPRNFGGVPSPVFRKPPPVFRPSRPLPMPPGNWRDGNIDLIPVTSRSLMDASPSASPADSQLPSQGQSPRPVVVSPSGKMPPIALPPIDRVISPPIDPGAGVAQPLDGALGEPPSMGGHYRLVATGFRVRHQTVDDMLERDGVGDEVFIRADVLIYRDHGNFLGRRSLRSALFGQNGDIRAGSGHQWNAAEEVSGGLITNDIYPLRRQRFDTAASPRPRDLPMVLWEGDLQPGEVVMVIPSIWEWDSNDPSEAERAWDIGLNAQAPNLHYGGLFLADDRNAPPPVQIIMPHVLTNILSVFDDGTRPIGAARHGGDFRSGSAGVNPPGIGLTAELAAAWVAAPHTIGSEEGGDGTAVSGEINLPPGAILLQLNDPPELEGRYDLELKLERLP